MAKERKRIFSTVPWVREYLDVASIIETAIKEVEKNKNIWFEITKTDRFYTSGALSDKLEEILKNSDLIIADTSDGNPNIMYEIGIAQIHKIPIILLHQESAPPPPVVLQNRLFIVYDRGALNTNLLPALVRVLTNAIESPTTFLVDSESKDIENRKMPSVFVGYSHVDKEHLKRLQVHLKPLEKSGTIDLWDDTKIEIGDKWKKEIERALERSVAAILLISADFLASDFIVKNELPPLLQSADKKGTRIFPVILKPCAFVRNENLREFQALNDPKQTLLELSAVEQERCWDLLSEKIENLLKTK